MNSDVRGGAGLRRGFALAAWIGVISGSACLAYAGEGAGYGGHGQHSASYGFPLKYHSVYGYGGRGVGVGVFGGYPFYGGPGYPCVEPNLNRFGKTTPFPFNAGPGYPRYGHSNYFEEPGPLFVDPPVAIITGPDYSGHFGPFTGAFPYPESYFAPYASANEGTGAARGSVSP